MVSGTPAREIGKPKPRLLLELTTAPVADDDVPLVADLAAEALAQSSLESHEHRVKCPKCGGTNVLLFETIRRRKAEMVTWATGGP